MSLSQIFNILQGNILQNGGTLKLSPTTIESPEINVLFDQYLLNENLVIDNAQATLNTGQNVTVSGEGNSLILFKTNVQLIFTVDQADSPSMTVQAKAVIQKEDGWTFGASFPSLKTGNWGGMKNPKNGQWIQYIFFDTASFTLSKEGLNFSGFLELVKGLEPLSILFNGMDKVEVKGKITVNKGKAPYVPSALTVVPEMELSADIGDVVAPIGDFNFKLSFSMVSTAYILPSGAESGKPVPAVEMLLKSTVPINDEEIGIAVSVGTQAGSLTMRALLPENTEIGISELVSLANNTNILATFPSNLPIVNDFVLKNWEITFNTARKSLTAVTIQVATRETFTWTIIPKVLVLESLSFWINVTYLTGKFDPALTIEGTVGIGDGKNQIRIDLSAAFPSYVFMGSLDPETPVDLRAILIHFLGPNIAGSLPNTLKLGALEIVVDSKNTTYSLSAALTTDLEIPAVLTTIVVRSISVNVDYVAGAATGSISGGFQIGTQFESPEVEVTAAYNGPEEGWMFSGALAEGSEIKLKEVIDSYLPEQYRAFNPLDITIDNASVSFTQGAVRRYNFSLGGNWKIDLGFSEVFLITARTEIAHDASKALAAQYTGYVEGALNFGNLKVGARVDFKDKNNDYTFEFTYNDTTFQAKLTHNKEDDSVIEFTLATNTTLGDLIAMLVGAAIGQEVTLPAPWNVVNYINLKDFAFSFNITKKKIGLSYRPSVNLGFINIEELTLFYTYSDPTKVEFAITKGSFLGGAQPLPEPWDVLDPTKAPPVPGQGENVFRLDFLGLGQHVSLKSGLSPKSVQEAVDLLKAAFEKKATALLTNGSSPIQGTGLRFNASSSWLIGTQFVILDSFAIGIVFFDPDLYGLSVYANGPKAKIFQGLKFEILYKKVSDTVGVYMVYLKLPDAIRQIEFGAVSITLPSIRIYIYTNGDFKLDFGFPVNEDFSESFGLQWLPFTGAGGFYFGALSAASAEKMPVTTKGNFSPVIVFGVGLQVGIGKEFNKGILKAGITVTLVGIVEGTFAHYNSFTGSGKEDVTYYYILGKLSIVGHVYGSINFAIISAEVDLRVFVSARVVIEIYEPVLLEISAGVSVSLVVKINLGLFSININLSFSTTIQLSFTIGSRQPKPWEGNSLSIPYRLYALPALDTDDCRTIPAMNWLHIVPEVKIPLELWYIPQFTAATAKGANEQKSRVVAMLYLESSIDQQLLKKLVKKSVKGKTVTEEEDYSFTKFAKGVFLWTLGAYFNKSTQPLTVDAILESEITLENLNDILCYFSQDKVLEPFTAEQILKFIEFYLDIKIVIPPRHTLERTEPPELKSLTATEAQVSIFPMLPMLIFETPSETIYFDDEKAKYKYDNAQLLLIRDYFKQLATRKQENQTSQDEPGEKQSLATFMLIDYVALLAKEATQRAIDLFRSLPVPVPENQSVNDLVSLHPNWGISGEELAFSNRTRPLSAGIELRVINRKYTVKRGDTHDLLATRFNVTREAILAANSFNVTRMEIPPDPAGPEWKQRQHFYGHNDAMELIPGETINLPVFTHTTASDKTETLLSIANQHGLSIPAFIAGNLDVPGLFPAGNKILVPYTERATVRSLLDEMEKHHAFEQLSGLSANVMLQGLRVPLPVEDSKIGEPEALYVVSGQEIDGALLEAQQSLTLKLDATAAHTWPWLKLGDGGFSLPFRLQPDDVAALRDLQSTVLKPNLLELKALDLCEVQFRKYSLPSHIAWQTPDPVSLANTASTVQNDNDPGIWAFKNTLQALITGVDAIAPKVKLLRQVQDGKPKPIDGYAWSTQVAVELRQVQSSEWPGSLMPNVYEVQAIDQASMTYLRNLIEYYDKDGTDIIDRIDILYTKEPAKEGQTAPPSGLRSDSITNTTFFLLQTNLSTLSNPSQMPSSLAGVKANVQPNLLGMTPLEFVKYIWEASIVGTGGYLLYYQVKDTKAGLPDYIFNSDNQGSISLLITYSNTNDILEGFMNSVVIHDQIDITSEILYVETEPLTTQALVMSEHETLHALTKRHRTSVSHVALQNPDAALAAGLEIVVPKGSLQVHKGFQIETFLSGKDYSRRQVREVNHGIMLDRVKPGDVINLPSFTYTTQAGDTLGALAAAFHVSVIALAHANKMAAGLFEAPLTFDTRIEVKVATVPSGNIGFTMTRENPANRTGPTHEEKALEGLYNLLEYNIAPNKDFEESVPGLPVAQGDKSYQAPDDPNMVVRPTALTNENWHYDRIVPVFSSAKPPVQTNTKQPLAWPAIVQNILARSGKKLGTKISSNRIGKLTADDIPPEKENPYRAVGKSAQIDLRWNDIFGNQTSFVTSVMPGVPPVLPPVKVGYIDPVLGLDQYPSVTGSYIVENDRSGKPQLSITLAFNPIKYQPHPGDEDGWRKRAEADRETYKQIYYQLIQEDMKVTISVSLEPAPLVFGDPDYPKSTLLALVLEIYQYLGAILLSDAEAASLHKVAKGESLLAIASKYKTTPELFARVNPSITLDHQVRPGQKLRVPEATIPADKIITHPVADKNPLSLFKLTTTWKLSRELDLVDDNFKDEPSVIFAVSNLGPNLTKPASSGKDAADHSITVQEFARMLQNAFPNLKAASGAPQAGVVEDTDVEIWLARFNDSATGIQFEILNPGNPLYFALQPLSTHLLSRNKVKIYPYTPGKPIYDNIAGEVNFNGIDLEKLAEDFLNSVDLFLQADYAIPAWMIQNGAVSTGTDGQGTDIPHPYDRVIQAKKDLAENIVKHLSRVLLDGNEPTQHNYDDAQEKLKQQLLINLSDAYTIDTILQFNVQVTSPFKQQQVIAPNLFGKVRDPDDSSKPDQKAYAFSTSRFSLETSTVSPPGSEKLSYLSILFNTKKENDQDSISYFPIKLQYEISSMEHDIRNSITARSSSWVTFILPFGNEDTLLGDLKIPIPLRAYPTAPSLTEQTFTAVSPQFKGAKNLTLASEDKLDEAKRWNYHFTYDYIRAQQDTILIDLLLNVQPTVTPKSFPDEEDPDLFAALLQFANANHGIQSDFTQYLLDQSSPEFAFTAMQSFAWLVGRVAKAWGPWVEQKKAYKGLSEGDTNYHYQVEEGETTIDGQKALLVNVSRKQGTNFPLPDVGIRGFTADPQTPGRDQKSFAYYVEEQGQRKYLAPDDPRRIDSRTLSFTGFNIIAAEDAWSGLAIIRNKDLVPGKQTNEDFFYETPVIRYVNVLSPLLDPAIEINIADYTAGTDKETMQVYLSNFFKAFFKETADKTTTRQIKIGANYSYDIHAELKTVIPISMTTPVEFKIPADWDTSACPAKPGDVTPDSPLVCQLTALLVTWFRTFKPVTTNGRFVFDLSLFSSLSNTQLPILIIRNLYLEVSKLNSLEIDN